MLVINSINIFVFLLAYTKDWLKNQELYLFYYNVFVFIINKIFLKIFITGFSFER